MYSILVIQFKFIFDILLFQIFGVCDVKLLSGEYIVYINSLSYFKIKDFFIKLRV